MEKEFRAIDYASMIPLGSDEEWEYDPDNFSLHSEQTMSEGRSYYLSRSSEFEETLYRVDSKEEEKVLVTPMFPNGFLDDISYYSNVIRDQNKGTVFIDHGTYEGQDEYAKVIDVTLLNQFGKEVGEKVSMTTNGTSSALFFNVTPGAYTVVIKSTSGSGLWYDTALVYSDTMTYVRTGSPLYRAITSPSDDLAEN
jgi:hypothetical protein